MRQLHFFFLPLMTALDIAKLFTSHGLKTTIVSTPAFAEPVKKAQDSGIEIGLILIKFPLEKSELPDHITSLDQAASDELAPKFVKALSLIQEPVEKLMQELQEFNPSFLVSDMFLPWTADSAAKFGIPRLVFHGNGYFSLCASYEKWRHKPFQNVSHDSEQFLVPNLPHQVKFVRTQMADFDLEQNKDDFTKLMQQVREKDERSYGVLVNSFFELESSYADHYKKVLGRKAWSIGPLFLWKNRDEVKEERGEKSSINAHECLSWLDSKKRNSVVYVCFGSMANFAPSQLNDIANGLDDSGQDFIWVVRERKREGENEEWLPVGFEERMRERGLIIRGWAPQVMILDHLAIGAFVTHCGWNSTLEGICAGVPMVTWPLFAEQFYNEKLVTDVLRIGVSVGNKKWQRVENEGVAAEAVELVMVGESAAEMRKRAANYKELARKTVEEGGSSYNDLSALIQDLSAYNSTRKQHI